MTTQPPCAGREQLYEDADHETWAVREAKAICATCPLQRRIACLEEAMRIESWMPRSGRWSVWGGLTTKERWELYRQRAGLAS